MTILQPTASKRTAQGLIIDILNNFWINLLSHFFDIQPKFSSILRCFLSSTKITYNYNSPTAVESRGSFHQVSEHRAAS